MLAFAPTIPSEGRALGGHNFSPARFASLTMPALFLAGSESGEWLTGVMQQLMPYMPQAKQVTLEGQGHAAMVTAPKLFADTVLAFLSPAR